MLIINKVFGLLTYPFRLGFWLLCLLTRHIGLGNEKDPWVLTMFSIILGVLAPLGYLWSYAGALYFGGTAFGSGIRPYLFILACLVPLPLIIRLLVVVEPDWFINYWDMPPPDLMPDDTNAGNMLTSITNFYRTGSHKTTTAAASNTRPPVFHLGNMQIKENALFLGIICTGGIGSGKCWCRGTYMLMYDGSRKAVEAIVPGDRLMGPDSKPRTVLALGRGRAPAYWIQPHNRPPDEGWGCNDVHMMTLQHTGGDSTPPLRAQAKQQYRPTVITGCGQTLTPQIVDVELQRFLDDGASPHWQLFRVPVQFEQPPEAAALSAAYFYRLGRWLTEHNPAPPLPLWALTASREKRLALLAGLLHQARRRHACGSFQLIVTTPTLADQVVFLCRSLGVAADKDRRNSQSRHGASAGVAGSQWRVSIRGATDCCPHPAAPLPPTPAARPYAWQAQPIGDQDYYGFTLDGDGRCLLADFTVTHNTAAFVYPFLDQLLKRYNTKENRKNCGGLLLDVKGEFIESAITLMRRAGRNPEEDIVLINPDDPWTNRYNPIVPKLHHIQLAGRFRAILNNLGGGGGDSFWLDSAEKVLTQAILLARVNKDFRTNGAERANLGDVEAIISAIESCKAEVRKCTNHWATLKTPSGMDRQQELEFNDLRNNARSVTEYFTDQWLKMAEQTRSGIQAAVSNQLLRGFTDPKLRRVFCQDTDFSFADTCDKGRIVVLQAPGWGMTALMIGAALKLDFQQCMKDRLFRPGADRDRRVFFLCDEYQEYVTCGGQMEGDETFYAVSRQSRVINAVATQSFNSIYAKVKSKEAVKVLLQNLRVKICLNGEDSETAKHVAELCGKHEQERQSGYSKTGILDKNAKGRTKNFEYRDKAEFEEWDFYRLQTRVERTASRSFSEAIVYNGGAEKGERPTRKVQLKPIWLDAKEKTAAKSAWEKIRVAIRTAEEQRLRAATLTDGRAAAPSSQLPGPTHAMPVRPTDGNTPIERSPKPPAPEAPPVDPTASDPTATGAPARQINEPPPSEPWGPNDTPEIYTPHTADANIPAPAPQPSGIAGTENFYADYDATQRAGATPVEDDDNLVPQADYLLNLATPVVDQEPEPADPLHEFKAATTAKNLRNAQFRTTLVRSLGATGKALLSTVPDTATAQQQETTMRQLNEAYHRAQPTPPLSKDQQRATAVQFVAESLRETALVCNVEQRKQWVLS